MNNDKKIKADVKVLLISVALILGGALMLDLTKMLITGMVLGFMGAALLIGLARVSGDEKETDN